MSEPHSDPHAHDDHGHHGSPFVQHHYDDAQHQFDSGKLAIWLFLAQEVLFFSALFVQYVLYRVHHGEIFSYAHKWLDVKYGAINTAVLIFSSLTAAWAVRAAQRKQRGLLIGCLAVTIGCALTFLGIKYIEYSHKVHEHILFGRYFDPCISPGEVELLTRNNECPGTKGTVEWDYAGGKPKEGCFDVDKIDVDPHTEGVQADCTVTEVKLSGESSSGPQEGRGEVGSRPITNRCPDESFEEGAKKETPKFPCWRPAYQPAVCEKVDNAAALRNENKLVPQVGILVEYGDHEERKDIKIKAECKPPPPPAPVGDIFAEHQEEHKLGDKAIKPMHVLTTHEEHEREAMGPPPEHTNMFLTIYFAMTGLHGIHVLVGVFVFIWLLIRAIKGQFTPDYFGPVDYAALYWHIVDLIWIFLFPLLYLIH